MKIIHRSSSILNPLFSLIIICLSIAVVACLVKAPIWATLTIVGISLSITILLLVIFLHCIKNRPDLMGSETITQTDEGLVGSSGIGLREHKNVDPPGYAGPQRCRCENNQDAAFCDFKASDRCDGNYIT